MDNNDNHEKKSNAKLKNHGLTIISLIIGLVLAGSVIYFSNGINQYTVSDSAPLAYLLNPAQPTGPGGSYGTTGIAGSPSSLQHQTQNQCLTKKHPDMCLANSKTLCGEDLEIARIAWKYFEKNYNPETGLYNSANNFPSTTMWDTGSALAATIAARDFDFIDQKEFDDRIMAMFKTLNTMQLFNNEAPNKVYNTKTAAMVDYANKPVPDGIGVSILDLGRLASWLNTLQCMHPRYKTYSKKALERWNYDRLFKDGEMYGLARDKVSNEIKVLQEGRLGYEQYAAKIFQNLGFDMHVAATYNNRYRRNIDIMDVSIAYDKRDPREFGANNYVITESYSMDAQENNIDSENRPLLENIFNVQKERWKRTGIVTAVSEDNIDRKPWFIYNTIFNAGIPWSAVSPNGDQFSQYKTISTKAALSLAVLYPEEEYSQVLMDTIKSAYSKEAGWYSGVYESGLGYNKALTANTNGNVMANILYKRYGSFYELCSGCKRMVALDSKIIKPMSTCSTCQISTLEAAKDNAAEQYVQKSQTKDKVLPAYYAVLASTVVEHTITLNPVYAADTPVSVAVPYDAENSVEKYNGQYRVIAGDTLFRIAQRHNFSGLHSHQTAFAIFIKNPQAFKDSNPHQLMAGQTLYLPTRQEAQGIVLATATRLLQKNASITLTAQIPSSTRQAKPTGRNTKNPPLPSDISPLKKVLMKKVTAIESKISNLQQTIPTQARQEQDHFHYQKQLHVLLNRLQEQHTQHQQRQTAYQAQLHALLAAQQKISQEQTVLQQSAQALQPIAKQISFRLPKNLTQRTTRNPGSFFLNVASHNRRKKPLPPLLKKTEELYCATNKQDAALVLHQLFGISPREHAWPDEWLGYKPGVAMLHAGTMDILLATLYRNIRRFPELSQLTERVTLQWNYCPLTDYGNGFYNLLLTDNKIAKTKALPDLTAGWEGFRQWGFLPPPANENNRYVPKLLAAHEPYHAFEIFLHRVYRQHCFPHPTTGRIFTETDQYQVLTRVFYPPQPEKVAPAYPYTWQPVCEIPQVQHKLQTAWPSRFLQQAKHNLISVKNKSAAIAKQIKQLKHSHEIKEQAFTVANKALELEISKLEAREKERKSALALQRQKMRQLKAMARKAKREVEEKIAEQQLFADLEKRRIEMANHEAAIKAEQRRLARLDIAMKQQTITLDNQLAKLEAEKKQREKIGTAEKHGMQHHAAENKQRAAVKALQLKLKNAATVDFANTTSPPADFIPLAHSRGTTPAITVRKNTQTTTSAKKPAKKLGITTTAIYTYPLSGEKPSAKLSVNWAPLADWFASASLRYVNSEEFTYSWGFGYRNWRPGTTSVQLNNWGPIKSGEGLAFDKAELSISHKIDSAYLRDKKISASLGFSQQLSGDPAFNATVQWSPIKNWYIRTTASQKFKGGKTNWTYSFGHYDWRPGTWRVEYSNYGSKNRHPFDNFSEGAITINRAWAF